MGLEDELAAHHFLVGIRRERVNARKVGHCGFGVPFDGSCLTVDGHSREVANVLVGTRELIEERCLSTVLVADESKRNLLVDNPLMLVRTQFERCCLAVAWVFVAFMVVSIMFIVGMRLLSLLLLAWSDLNFLSISFAECQFVVLNKQFHWVTHWCVFHQFHFLSGNNAGNFCIGIRGPSGEVRSNRRRHLSLTFGNKLVINSIVICINGGRTTAAVDMIGNRVRIHSVHKIDFAADFCCI